MKLKHIYMIFVVITRFSNTYIVCGHDGQTLEFKRKMLDCNPRILQIEFYLNASIIDFQFPQLNCENNGMSITGYQAPPIAKNRNDYSAYCQPLMFRWALL